MLLTWQCTSYFTFKWWLHFATSSLLIATVFLISLSLFSNGKMKNCPKHHIVSRRLLNAVVCGHCIPSCPCHIIPSCFSHKLSATAQHNHNTKPLTRCWSEFLFQQTAWDNLSYNWADNMPLKTSSPVYNIICCSSVAFHQRISDSGLGFQENSCGI